MEDVLTNKQRRMLSLLVGENEANWRTPDELTELLNARLGKSRKAERFSRAFVVNTVSPAGTLGLFFLHRPDSTPGSSELEYRLSPAGRLLANEAALVHRAKARNR